MRALNVDNVPDELKEYDQWVCWRPEPKKDGKVDKIPVTPGVGRNAKSNDPTTWRPYQEAVDYYKRHRKTIAGIGFVLSKKDPFAGGDLDSCRDPETGAITDKATRTLKRFNTYSEISPSDTGVRFFCRGKLPGTGKTKDGIELYDRGRFLTITGGWLGDYSGNIEDRSKEVLDLYKELAGDNGKKGTKLGQNPPGWQDELISGVSGGSRHATALRLAARWAAKGFSQTEITHFLLTWNQSNKPPKTSLADPSSKEFQDIIAYATQGKQEGEQEALVAFPAHVMAGVAGDFAELYSNYLESPRSSSI